MSSELREAADSEVVSSRAEDAKIPALLSLFLAAALIFPADMVIGAVGAMGYVGMLAAILLFALWGASAAFGVHDPFQRPSPARLALVAMWLVSIVTYIATPLTTITPLQRAAADRWLLALVGISGVVLYMSEALRSLNQVATALKALTLGATTCALIAAYQFLTFSDPLDLLRASMPGFSENGGNTTFQIRSPFVRVAGSTFSPIELGVISSMILPFAIWRAIFDRGVARRWIAWGQVALITAAAVMTVSRSAILSISIMAVFFIPTLPTAARRWAMVIAPISAAAVFLALPGFVSVITEAFGAGTSDPSLATRVTDYPRVERLFSEHPWTGLGPGGYAPTDALEILDNQYLYTAVTMGIVGVGGLVAFFLLPMAGSLQVSWCAKEVSVKCLAGAATAGSAIAIVSSGTFDSFSFPVFILVLAVNTGFSAVVWHIAEFSGGTRVTASSGKGVQNGSV